MPGRRPEARTLSLNRRGFGRSPVFDLRNPCLFFAAPTPTVPDLRSRIGALTEGFSPGDTAMIEQAFQLLTAHFTGQTRRSGEPVINHYLRVAEGIRFRFGLREAKAIAAAALHDYIEDRLESVVRAKTENHPGASLTVLIEEAHRELLADISSTTDPEVAQLVDGVTKLSKTISGTKQKHESYKKLIRASLSDIRVVVIKWSDALDNSRDQHVFSHRKGREHAGEFYYVYARFAERLGVHRVMTELEAPAIPYLFPASSARNLPAYTKAADQVNLAAVLFMQGLLERLSVRAISVEPQRRPFPEAHKFMQEIGMTLEEYLFINPFYLNPITVIVEQVRDIRKIVTAFTDAAFDLPLHIVSVENMLSRQTKKATGYRACHVYCSSEELGEQLFVLLTPRMQARNEWGIISRLRRGAEGPLQKRRLDWQQVVLEYLEEGFQGSDDDMQAAIADFTSLFIAYTPTRQPINLVKRATGLDFAYRVAASPQLAAKRRIGPSLWQNASEMIVNVGDKSYRTSIFSPVPPEAVVKVLPDPTATPKPSWLSHAKMPETKAAIQQYLQGLPEAEQKRLGTEALDDYSRQYHVLWEDAARVSFMPNFLRCFARRYHLSRLRTPDDLVLRVGRGDLAPQTVGDAFNSYYSARIKKRKKEKIFRPLYVEIEIERDRPGLLDDIFKRFHPLKINIEESYSGNNPSGSAKIALILSAYGSLQVAQIHNIINEYLAEVGGGKIVRSYLGHRREKLSLASCPTLPPGEVFSSTGPRPWSGDQ